MARALMAILIMALGLGSVTFLTTSWHWDIGAAPLEDDGSTIPIPPPAPPTSVPDLPVPGDVEAASFSLEVPALDPTVRLQTRGGHQVLITEGSVVINTGPGEVQTISLPLAMLPGAELASFRDATSGIAWEPGPEGSKQGLLTLPIPGIEASLILLIKEVRGTGQRTEGDIAAVELRVEPRLESLADLSGGKTVFSAALLEVPSEVRIKSEAIAGADEDLRAAVIPAFSPHGDRVLDIAYAVHVEFGLAGLSGAQLITTASVTMEVTRNWVGGRPVESLKILRLDDGGRVQFLDTQPINTDNPAYVGLLATSPEGFSTFALAATEAALSKGGNDSGAWAIGLGVGLGVALLVAALTAAFLLRRRGQN